jgi:hypothetical protein
VVHAGSEGDLLISSNNLTNNEQVGSAVPHPSYSRGKNSGHQSYFLALIRRKYS